MLCHGLDKCVMFNMYLGIDGAQQANVDLVTEKYLLEHYEVEAVEFLNVNSSISNSTINYVYTLDCGM